MASTIAVLGWEAMDAAERYAAIGGTAGFISVAVTVVIAWVNWRALKRQIDISVEANATAKLANEVTKLSVEDQLEMSRRARTAAVRIAEAGFCDGATARENGDLDAIPWFYDGKTDVDHPVMTLKLINEGMGSAYNIQLTPISVENVALSSSPSSGLRMMKGRTEFRRCDGTLRVQAQRDIPELTARQHCRVQGGGSFRGLQDGVERVYATSSPLSGIRGRDRIAPEVLQVRRLLGLGKKVTGQGDGSTLPRDSASVAMRPSIQAECSAFLQDFRPAVAGPSHALRI